MAEWNGPLAQELKPFVIVAFALSLCLAQKTGDIRLFGGGGSHEGRVEVYNRNQWGTVCNDSWTMEDVHVVCRQFGNRTAVTFNVSYLEGQGPVWYHDVNCLGSEDRLKDCELEESNVDRCSHAEDAGAQCGPKEQDLRLVNGSTPNEGRVEIYRESEASWGLVCRSATWGKQEADVVCRHVGYPSGSIESTGEFGTDSVGRAWLGDVICTGSEGKLGECRGSILSRTSCEPDKQASVVCNTEVLVPAEELSTGAIAGISIGFILVIIVCCLFSLNCKCRAFWKKREVDDTDVYHADNADSRNYSSSQVKTEVLSGNSASESQQEPVSDFDPNMFVFAPKNPPPGFGSTPPNAAGADTEKLQDIEEATEQNGMPPTANRDDGESHAYENHITVSMDSDESKDTVAACSDDRQPLADADVDHQRADDEGVTISPDTGAYFHVAGTADEGEMGALRGKAIGEPQDEDHFSHDVESCDKLGQDVSAPLCSDGETLNDKGNGQTYDTKL